MTFYDKVYAGWFDPDLLDQRGAIVIGTPERKQAIVQEWLEKHPLTTLELPYRRTLQKAQHTYKYYFSPPRNCRNVSG